MNSEKDNNKNDAPSDYAALLRSVRNTENLKLEIHQLNNHLKTSKAKISTLENQVKQYEEALNERDEKLEELQNQVGDKSKGMLAKLKQKDETIQRLQQSLQNKHRELEDFKASKGRRRI